ncbi:MAG: DUF4388 domain-containing protein [Acidimicrobiales bacterium]
MTTEARPTAERASLEGTLGDLALFEVLELLACGRQTGTLYIAGSLPAAITTVDGEVSYATNDPSCSLREVLLDRSLITEDDWDAATKAKDVELGSALVAESGAQVGDLRDAVHEHIVATTYELTDLVDGRFRFVPGARHSMGPGYAYPVSVLRGDVATRREAWQTISDLVPNTSVIAQLNERAPEHHAMICVAARDWPVIVALDGQRPLRELIGVTRMTSFAICESVHRLVTAGLATVID